MIEKTLAKRYAAALLAQPQVPRAMKKRLLRRPFEGRAKTSFLDFLDLLVDKNRQEILPDIADMFDRLADASQGVVRVQVKSWRPLTDAQRAGLQGKLERLTGKKILIEAAVDPALKGGMLVQVGDTVIDGSVAQRLKELGERFRELQRR